MTAGAFHQPMTARILPVLAASLLVLLDVPGDATKGEILH